ncbi:hypothetical protein IW262DRAFT_1403201 [Armillaria fumosa]|nr:hypothetical protein IW262DRAFT_1403201 [Armillaria fumosa]
MAPQCPICLSSLTDPVCPPCGHIFCSTCLRSAITQVNNGSQAPCPYCRKVFHIAIPGIQYVPLQFRSFVVDPIRSVYITTDDSQDQQDTRQRNESLERENRQLRERIQELEADGSEESEEGFDAPILVPSFAAPNVDPVVSSNFFNSLNIAGDSAHTGRAFIHPPNTIHIGPARLLAPVSAMGPNRPNSGETLVERFAFTRSETRTTPSARPGAVSMPSTVGNGTSTAVFTNPFSRPELQHSIPSNQRGSGLPSTVHPSFVNSSGISLSGPNNAGQWTIPSNHALNVPNQPIPAPQIFNSAGTRQFYARRESQPRMTTPAPAGQGPSAMSFTMVDVPAPSPSSGTESRGSSQSS